MCSVSPYSLFRGVLPMTWAFFPPRKSIVFPRILGGITLFVWTRAHIVHVELFPDYYMLAPKAHT
jgi:hypothetical protein